MTRSPRFILHLPLVVAVAVTLAACGGGGGGGDPATPLPTSTPIRTPVPTSTATRTPVPLPGLPASVEVIYDSIGIPHIYGPDLNSVTFVQGYVHAAHRFWKMDLLRRAGEGRLSELFGLLTLRDDVARRTIFTTRGGSRMEEAMWERI